MYFCGLLAEDEVGRSRAEYEAELRSTLVSEFHSADVNNDGQVTNCTIKFENIKTVAISSLDFGWISHTRS